MEVFITDDRIIILEIIVVGMHRSGTSLVCSILNKMGVYFGDTALLMRDQSNEKGYFERFQINEVQDYILRFNGYSWVKISGYDAGCLGKVSQQIFDNGMRSFFNECRAEAIWGVKDPRICLTFPLWRKHLEHPVCVFAFRNPCHVAKSLNRRDGFSLEYGLALWEKYNVLGLNNIRGLPIIFTDFDSVTSAPDYTINKLYSDLLEIGVKGIRALDEREIGSLVDRKLVHHSEGNPGYECNTTTSQKKLYAQLKTGEASKGNGILSVPERTERTLKDYEDLIVHGTKEGVLNQKLVDMIDGERALLLAIGSASSRLGDVLHVKRPEARVVTVAFDPVRKCDQQYDGGCLYQSQENLLKHIASTCEEKEVDLLILDRVIYKLESPTEMLLGIRRYLAPNAQILVLDKNTRNILAMNKLLEHGIWQSANGSTFDFRDGRLLTVRELIRMFTVCGYQVLSSEYNLDPRLEKLYIKGSQRVNRPDLHLGKFVIKRVTGKELRELCSNFMILSLANT